MPQLPPQERENNNIGLGNVIIEDEEEGEAENSDVKAAGRPSNYDFLNDFLFRNQLKTFNPAQVQEKSGSVTSVKTKWFVPELPSLVKSSIGSLKINWICQVRYQNNPW